MKHVGKIKNTGRRCIVVFRELYNEKGEVIDGDNCLVVETESLPDAEHQDIIRIVESEQAQSTGDVFNVFARNRLGNGMPALEWMHKSGRLRKFPTNNVTLTPDSQHTLGLDALNKIVRMQQAGASQADIENAMRDDTDSAPRTATQNQEPVAQPTDTGDAVLDDAAIAKSYLSQADMFEAQAADLRKQAYEMDPSLAPKKRTRKTPPKKEA